MTDHFQKGDIIRGSKKDKDKAYHPIIYLGERDSTFFVGAMLTHSSNYENVKLEDAHFDQKINWDSRPSYFVRARLLKKKEWGPFEYCGKLSEEGMRFVLKYVHTEEIDPLTWEDYTKKD